MKASSHTYPVSNVKGRTPEYPGRVVTVVVVTFEEEVEASIRVKTRARSRRIPISAVME